MRVPGVLPAKQPSTRPRTVSLNCHMIAGFVGKQIEYTVPDYNEDECVGGKFEILSSIHIG